MIDVQQAWLDIRIEAQDNAAKEAERLKLLREKGNEFYKSIHDFLSDSNKKIDLKRTQNGLTLDADAYGLFDLNIITATDFDIAIYSKPRGIVPAETPKKQNGIKDEYEVCRQIAKWFETIPAS